MGFQIASRLSGTAVLAAFLSTSAVGLAHIELVQPLPRLAGRAGGNQLKTGPCGQSANGRTASVSEFAPGSTVTVSWTEYLDHDSYYRIAFDADGDDDFPIRADMDSVVRDGDDPMSVFPIGDVVLAYVFEDPDLTDYSVEVELPDLECETCTLQIVQFMYDKIGNGSDDEYYFQCADIALRSSDEPPAGGAGGQAGEGGNSGTPTSAGEAGSGLVAVVTVGDGGQAAAGAGNTGGNGSVGSSGVGEPGISGGTGDGGSSLVAIGGSASASGGTVASAVGGRAGAAATGGSVQVGGTGSTTAMGGSATGGWDSSSATTGGATVAPIGGAGLGGDSAATDSGLGGTIAFGGQGALGGSASSAGGASAVGSGGVSPGTASSTDAGDEGCACGVVREPGDGSHQSLSVLLGALAGAFARRRRSGRGRSIGSAQSQASQIAKCSPQEIVQR